MLYVKRILDFLLSTIFLIIFMPIMLIITVLIKIDSKGPIFFVQERAGIKGRAYKIYKFRTMIINAEKMGEGYYTGREDPRITRVGRILRETSLDELPQLINIIKGDMSIVGPRPALIYQIKEYNEFQKRRLNMRPGITGWAQVNGRNSLSWPERIEKDIWYIENWSLRLDFIILFKTAVVVFKKEGIYAEKEKFFINDKSDKNKME